MRPYGRQTRVGSLDAQQPAAIEVWIGPADALE